MDRWDGPSLLRVKYKYLSGLGNGISFDPLLAFSAGHIMAVSAGTGQRNWNSSWRFLSIHGVKSL